MLIGLMLMFAFGNLLSALAPNYPLLLIARFISGVPHGAYFGVAALTAASLVPPDRRARAVGRVMLGLTIANIFGVPLATRLGQWLGWRADFLLVGTLGILTMIGVRIFLPPIHAGGATPRRELGVILGHLLLEAFLGARFDLGTRLGKLGQPRLTPRQFFRDRHAVHCDFSPIRGFRPRQQLRH